MICPNCGHENPGGASCCANCSESLTNTKENQHSQPVKVKISRFAITAILLAICGLMLLFAGIIATSLPRPLDSRKPIFIILLNVGIYSFISAIILGFISYILIEISGGKKTGRGFAVNSILISIFAIFLSNGIIFLSQVHQIAFRMVCGTNLSGIGKAMLIYAHDYEDKFPCAGGKTSIWGTSLNWDAENRQQAYGVNSDGTGGTATISSSLYLLVKYAEVNPKSFICKGDKKMSEFKPKKYGGKNKNITGFWDFGPKPWKHNSYSYQIPYGPNVLKSTSYPDIPVAADRNPFMLSPGWKVKDITKFNPDGDKSMIQNGNTPTHVNEGQNVLYLDSHVNFENVSFCGINEDNIYTSWNGSDIRKGTPPKVGSQPANKLDSLLVNDSPVKK